jgi:3-oxoacyl-[acyl-carrier protein] reductase
MNLDFSDKTIIITGATRGIGAAIAKQLHNTGASLILTGTSSDQINKLNNQLLPDLPQKIEFKQVNFLDPTSLAAFIKYIESKNKIDICINNAGINILSSFDNISTDKFSDILNVNCIAPFRLCQAVSKIMRDNNYGRIVNIASIWSVITREKRGSYTTAKSAMVGFTKTLAVEMAQFDVLVNCVSPGFIKTELTDKSMSSKEQDELKKIIPSKRLGHPDEIARLVLFLASDANSYITGQNIVADGGYTIV